MIAVVAVRAMRPRNAYRDPAARAVYQSEKLRLAAEHDDVMAWTEAKTPAVRRLQDASILPP